MPQKYVFPGIAAAAMMGTSVLRWGNLPQTSGPALGNASISFNALEGTFWNLPCWLVVFASVGAVLISLNGKPRTAQGLLAASCVYLVGVCAVLLGAASSQTSLGPGPVILLSANVSMLMRIQRDAKAARAASAAGPVMEA